MSCYLSLLQRLSGQSIVPIISVKSIYHLFDLHKLGSKASVLKTDRTSTLLPSSDIRINNSPSRVLTLLGPILHIYCMKEGARNYGCG